MWGFEDGAEVRMIDHWQLGRVKAFETASSRKGE